MANNSDIAMRVSVEPVTEAGISYSRTATRMKVARAIWELWDQMRKEDQLDQNWLAARLGKDKSQISKLLKNPGNWTLDTISDLLEAMEGKITLLEVKRYKEISSISSASPSLDGLREAPKFWNVVTVLVKSQENEESIDGYLNIDIGNTAVVTQKKSTR